MKNKSDLALMLFFVFLILGGVLIAYGSMEPIVYEKEPISTTDKATSTTQAVQPSYPLNINTATAEELATIDGVGISKAYAIVDYREHLGGYTSVEQIKDIKGFGDATYLKIAGYLTV